VDSSKYIFGVAQCMLATFDGDRVRPGLASERLNALAVFVNLSSREASRKCAPPSEWAIIARHFVFDVLCGSEHFEGREANAMNMYLVDLLDNLLGCVTESGTLLSLVMYTCDALLVQPSASFFAAEGYDGDLGESDALTAFGEWMLDCAGIEPAPASPLGTSGHTVKLLKLLLTIPQECSASFAASVVIGMLCGGVSSSDSFEAKVALTHPASQLLVDALGSEAKAGAALLDCFVGLKTSSQAAIAETVLMIWSTPRSTPLGYSGKITSHLLTEAPIALLTAATKIIQADLSSRGRVFASAFFPDAILLMSQTAVCRDTAVLVPLCQLMLTMYAVTAADQRPDYLGVFVPALSTALLVNENASDFVLYSGRALTQLAATQPGPVRECIQKLPEAHRASLQRAMKASMDQQSSIRSPQVAGAGAPKAIKKIDLSQFKK